MVQQRHLTPEEWNKIVSSLKDVNPQEIEELKSPGDKRTYDAASHGSLIISINTSDSKSKSYTHGFDNTDPHKKLKPLMQAILDLR